jgi:hypothetical protein
MRNRKTPLPACLALLAVVALLAPMAPAQVPSRFIGTVTAIGATTLTVKTDAGQSYQAPR